MVLKLDGNYIAIGRGLDQRQYSITRAQRVQSYHLNISTMVSTKLFEFPSQNRK